MTFSLAEHQEDKYVIAALNRSVWYHHNKKKVQAQQRKYRELNKKKVRQIWKDSRTRYYNKNKLAIDMYLQLVNLEKVSK